MFSADVLAAFTHALYIWDSYVGLVVTASFVGCIGCPLISVFRSLLVDISSSYGPFWLLASFEGFFQLAFFIFQQMFIGTDCLDSVFQGIDHTKFGWQMMVTSTASTDLYVWASYTLMLTGNHQVVASQ